MILMAKCPHCGIKLHIWNVKAECPKCGVNIANYDWERRLEEDSVVAEAAFAKLHESMRRFKFSFVGTKLRIARIPVSVLPLFSFLLPLGTLAVSIPYFEQNFTLNAITIVKNIMNLDLGGLISAPGSAVIGAPSLRLLLALLFVALSALSLPVSLVFLLLNFKKFDSKGLFVTNLLKRRVFPQLQHPYGADHPCRRGQRRRELGRFRQLGAVPALGNSQPHSRPAPRHPPARGEERRRSR